MFSFSLCVFFFFFKQKTAYEMRISDWSSDVCSSDLEIARLIISRDRLARKHGVSQNTIGEITTAIALAYEMGRNGQGYADLPGATHAAGIVDWEIGRASCRERVCQYV